MALLRVSMVIQKWKQPDEKKQMAVFCRYYFIQIKVENDIALLTLKNDIRPSKDLFPGMNVFYGYSQVLNRRTCSLNYFETFF